MTVTDDDLSRWEALCAAATPGPWRLRKVQVSGDAYFRKYVWRVEYDAHGMNEGASFHIAFMDTCEGGLAEQKRDGAFIAAAREGWPATIAEVRLLREVIADSADARPRLAAEVESLRAQVARMHGDPLVELYLKAGKERDTLQTEVSELRASLADAVGKIEVMERDLRHANILHAEDEAAIEALEQRVTDIAKGGEIIIAERDRMRADNDRLEAQVDALNARIGWLT